MTELKKKKCVPCEGGLEPLTRSKFAPLLEQVRDWQVVDNDKKIERELVFTDFKHALGFVNQVGEIAEEEGHHPNIYLYGWNKVKITLYTHAIEGLSENDFILAAKIDSLHP